MKISSKLFILSAFVMLSVLFYGCSGLVEKAGTGLNASPPAETVKAPEVTSAATTTPVAEIKPVSEENIPVIIINETQKIKIGPKSIDPDKDVVTYTFSAPFDANGEWQTKVGNAGEYPITITASDGMTSVVKKLVVVVKALNRAPVLGKILDVTVNEGEPVALSPVAVDPDGDAITIAYSGWMNSNTKATNFEDAGMHYVTVTASDGKLNDVVSVKVTVNNVNRVPELFPMGDVIALEGDKIQLKSAASDPDGDIVSFKFSAPFDEAGIWQTKEGDAGTYDITITASDGKLDASRTIKVIINPRNKRPVIEAIPDQKIDEGTELKFKLSAYDPDGDTLKITVMDLPPGARFNDETGMFTWTPGFDAVSSDEGTKDFVVKFAVSDGKETVNKDVKITVVNVNLPPDLTYDVVIS